MKLENITIDGFRSIDSTALSDCGGFNVLIGRNNAGKSNILLAIDLFFSSLRSRDSVVVFPAPVHSIDYFKGETERPIKLSFDFRLTLSERDSLIQDIGSTAPQVKNAVEGLDPDLRLLVTLAFHSERVPYGLFEQLVLHRAGVEVGGKADVSSRVILRIDDAAGKELAARARKAQIHARNARTVREYMLRFDRYSRGEDWEAIRSDPMRLRRYAYFEASEEQPSRDLVEKLEKIIRTAETKAAATQAVEALTDSIEGESATERNVPLENRIESISGKEATVPAYASRLLEKLGELDVLFLRERRDPIGKREAEQLLSLKITRGGPEKLRAIQETVSALLGVDIDAFKASGREDSPAEMDVDRFLVQVNGAGIREALRLILDYEFGQPDILLVEEPEIHLHPALETSMMRYLKKTGKLCQIFITTHSTNFLDAAEMRNVYLVSKDKATKVELVSLAEAEEAIPRELGIRLSALFMFDKLVFVEGPSDEDVLREWASILEINLSQASVAFIPMGGVRNLAHFATDQTLSFLSKRRVIMWFVLDRDERDESEIARLTELLGEQATLTVLQRRELENYLIVPRAVAEFIRLKRELGNAKDKSRPTDEEVAEAIDQCADELKELAVDRRLAKWACVPYYLNKNLILEKKDGKPTAEQVEREINALIAKLSDKSKRIKEVTDEARGALEREWEYAKTKIVPGDVLLDAVCKRFDVRLSRRETLRGSLF